MHAVHALHRPHRRFQDGTAGVAISLARAKHRLLADDAVTGDLLDLAIRISDDPVATKKLGRCVAQVFDRDRVGKHVAINFGFGLVIDIGRGDLNVNLALLLVHCSAPFNPFGAYSTPAGRTL